MTHTKLIGGRWAAATAAMLCLVAFAPLSAQSIKQPTGNAYGLLMRTGGTESRMASVDIPAEGGVNSAEEVSPASGGVTASSMTAVSSGIASTDLTGAQSVATASNVSLLGGKITAARVLAVVALSASRTRSSADADGSGIDGLTVNGVAMGDPAVNTRVELPGVGYVMLNEQVRGKGSKAALTVNMIHVYMTNGDEIVVGSASTSM